MIIQSANLIRTVENISLNLSSVKAACFHCNWKEKNLKQDNILTLISFLHLGKIVKIKLIFLLAINITTSNI